HLPPWHLVTAGGGSAAALGPLEHLHRDCRHIHSIGHAIATVDNRAVAVVGGLGRRVAGPARARILAERAAVAVRAGVYGARLRSRWIPAGVLVLRWIAGGVARDHGRDRIHARGRGLRTQASEPGARLVRLPRDLPHRHGDRLRLSRR